MRALRGVLYVDMQNQDAVLEEDSVDGRMVEGVGSTYVNEAWAIGRQ
jgi:hypothetical protein